MAAVCRILGTSLPTLGPGLSARSRCMVKPLPLSVLGTMASRNTRTPMPPTQWLKLRQYMMPLGRLSTSGRMEAPVVVKPETISKSASMNFGIAPESTKGRLPARERTIQLKATQTMPSVA